MGCKPYFFQQENKTYLLWMTQQTTSNKQQTNKRDQTTEKRQTEQNKYTSRTSLMPCCSSKLQTQIMLVQSLQFPFFSVHLAMGFAYPLLLFLFVRVCWRVESFPLSLCASVGIFGPSSACFRLSLSLNSKNT